MKLFILCIFHGTSIVTSIRSRDTYLYGYVKTYTGILRRNIKQYSIESDIANGPFPYDQNDWLKEKEDLNRSDIFQNNEFHSATIHVPDVGKEMRFYCGALGLLAVEKRFEDTLVESATLQVPKDDFEMKIQLHRDLLDNYNNSEFYTFRGFQFECRNLSFINETSDTIEAKLYGEVKQRPFRKTVAPCMYPDEEIPDNCTLPSKTISFLKTPAGFDNELIQNTSMSHFMRLSRILMFTWDLRETTHFYTGVLGMRVFRHFSNLLTESYPYDGSMGASMSVCVGYNEHRLIEFTYVYDSDKMQHPPFIGSINIRAANFEKLRNELKSKTSVFDVSETEVIVKDPNGYAVHVAR